MIRIKFNLLRKETLRTISPSDVGIVLQTEYFVNSEADSLRAANLHERRLRSSCHVLLLLRHATSPRARSQIHLFYRHLFHYYSQLDSCKKN